MSETVFFNPKNSLGNFQDYNEAVRSAKLYRQKHPEANDSNIIVVHGKNNESFDIFLQNDSNSSNEKKKSYTVKKEL